MMMQIAPAWLRWPETQTLAQHLTPIRFVGGCVRDAVLGRDVRDVDVATPLLPNTVMETLRANGIKVIPTGIDHGTVTAVIDGRHYEITTLRRDVTTDGRHAKVAFTDDWKEDASRRDFTMNALSCDTDGNVHDYFGGVADAQSGLVRFIGDAETRIEEDALRILRFFRFHAWYGKGPADEQGLTACAAQAAKITQLSGERIQQEMFKLLTAEKAADAVDTMQHHGIWPYVANCTVTVQSLSHLPQILQKTKQPADPVLGLALLLRSSHDIGPEGISALAQRWKLSLKDHKNLNYFCAREAIAANEKDQKKQIRIWGATLFTSRVLIALAEGMEETAGLAAIKHAQEWNVPKLPLSGDDLLARGVPAGKAIGEALRRLENEWEEADYTLTRDTLLARL